MRANVGVGAEVEGPEIRRKRKTTTAKLAVYLPTVSYVLLLY